MGEPATDMLHETEDNNTPDDLPVTDDVRPIEEVLDAMRRVIVEEETAAHSYPDPDSMLELVDIVEEGTMLDETETPEMAESDAPPRDILEDIDAVLEAEESAAMEVSPEVTPEPMAMDAAPEEAEGEMDMAAMMAQMEAEEAAHADDTPEEAGEEMDMAAMMAQIDAEEETAPELEMVETEAPPPEEAGVEMPEPETIETTAAPDAPPLEAETPATAPPDTPTDETPSDAGVISADTAEKSMGAIRELMQNSAAPTQGIGPQFRTGHTVEDLVLESLKPMLKEWLDTNLPGLVERIVAREIRKLTREVEE